MIYNKKRGACEAWAQMAWLATSGTQEGRIAHYHSDATVLCRFACRRKIGRLSETYKYFGIFLLFIAIS